MSFSDINTLINIFNYGSFQDEIQPFFGNVKNFIKYVKQNDYLDELDISMIPEGDYDEELFDYLIEVGLFNDLSYKDIPDGFKNLYLLHGLEHNYEKTVILITDEMITDVSIRPDGFYLRLSDREELSEFFCKSSRRGEGDPETIAKIVLSDDYYDYYDNFYSRKPSEVIDVLSEDNIIKLKDIIYSKIKDTEFSVSDFNSSWFEKLSEEQGNDGFFKINPENLNDLLKNDKAIDELMKFGELETIGDELNNIYNDSEKYAYESELYNLVYDGLSQFFIGNVIEEPIIKNEKPSFVPYIKLHDFIYNIKIFLNENKFSTYNDSVLEYYSSYTSLIKGMFYEKLIECIDFRSPDYADWTLTKKYVNELFVDHF
jgi:hypothetical protein